MCQEGMEGPRIGTYLFAAYRSLNPRQQEVLRIAVIHARFSLREKGGMVCLVRDLEEKLREVTGKPCRGVIAGLKKLGYLKTLRPIRTSEGPWIRLHQLIFDPNR